MVTLEKLVLYTHTMHIIIKINIAKQARKSAFDIKYILFSVVAMSMSTT